MNRALPVVSASAFAILANGAPSANAQELGPICTDRPTKANATCTVPAGKLQLETDFFNSIRSTSGGLRTTTNFYSNPTLKLGLSDRIDLQVNFAPYIETKVRDEATGTVLGTNNGSGDILVRLKARVWENDKASVSAIPFVKVPTAASGLGNDEWEGGVAVPVNFALPNKFSLTFGPEVDLLADADGSGYHVNVVNLVNLARPLSDKVTVIGEFWSSVNFDPLETIAQYSADVAVVYLLTPVLQFDAGANFGLNQNTPDTQFYVGLSARF